MNIKKILLISMTFLIILSCIGAVSAGLFDFLGSDSDSDRPISANMGNITDSDVYAVMIIENGVAVFVNDSFDTSSADVSYNVSCSVQVNISNLNDSSRKILEDGINEQNNTWTYINIGFNNSENRTTLLFTGDDSDCKIDGDILYINATDNVYNVGDVFSSDTTVSSVEIQVLEDSGNADGHLLAKFFAK